MNAQQKTARVAGLLYLGVVITGIFSLGYVPGKLVVWDDPALTLHNILTYESLFRMGIFAGILCYLFFLFLPFVLHTLLERVHHTYAKIMVILATVSVPLSLINIGHKFDILALIHAEKSLSLAPEQLQWEVLSALNQYDSGIHLVSLFWGLWLFPFGYLVYKSGFLPKILGILLMLGCLGYVINFSGSTLFAHYAELGISKYVQLPATFGEIGTCLWLLFVGVRSIKSQEESV